MFLLFSRFIEELLIKSFKLFIRRHLAYFVTFNLSIFIHSKCCKRFKLNTPRLFSFLTDVIIHYLIFIIKYR
nr:MAG TPA_asm: hypothetical protein [Caudoviricetes sp.]